MEKKQIWLLKWIMALAVMAILTMTFVKMTLGVGYVMSESMEPTLSVGARMVGCRLDHDYKRGDVVMFAAQNNGNVYYTKRIIGVPGDIISLTVDTVYINGKKLDEPYLKEDMENEVVGEYSVPAGSYFMMGDNRNNSCDSRYWDNTFVIKENIICKVRFVLFSNSIYKRMD